MADRLNPRCYYALYLANTYWINNQGRHPTYFLMHPEYFARLQAEPMAQQLLMKTDEGWNMDGTIVVQTTDVHAVLCSATRSLYPHG